MHAVRATLRASWICAAAALVAGCFDDARSVGRAPVIEEARPAAARPGQRVTLIGLNFGLPGPADGVTLGGAPARVESWADRAVLVTVPAMQPGTFDLVVRNGDRVSAPLPFEVRPVPDAGLGQDADGGSDVADVAP